MKPILKYIKARLPILILGLCIITGAIASMVYAKYAEDKRENADFDVVAEAIMNVTVTDNTPSDSDSHSYIIANETGGTVSAYVRFAVIVNWQDDEGNIWAVPPSADDYSVVASNCTKLADGYYYYNGVVDPDSSFEVTVTQTNPSNLYSMHVEIIAEGIQSVPATAVQSAWERTYSNGNWS